MTKIRSLSPLECTYLAGDNADSSSMINQYVVEGIGVFSALEWKSAIEVAADANPGIKLKLKGRLFWRYWDDQGSYPALKIYRSNWSGEDNTGAEFDGQPIDCRRGPCAEIHLLEGDFPKIIFRTHHALMDGNATLFWIKEVFRALRGEVLSGSDANLNEFDIVKKHQPQKQQPFSGSWASIFPPADLNKTLNTENECIWQSILFNKDVDRVLPKVVYFLDKKVRALYGLDAKVNFRVPSDLRRLLNEHKYHLGNLVAAIDFETINKSEVKIIYKNILQSLKNKKDLSIFPNNFRIATWLPKNVFKPNSGHIKNLHQQGLCDITAIVTHVGKVFLSDFSYEGFKATNIYALPLPLPGVSLSCVFLSHDKGLSLCMSAPSSVVTHQGLKELAYEMKNEFSE